MKIFQLIGHFSFLIIIVFGSIFGISIIWRQEHFSVALRAALTVAVVLLGGVILMLTRYNGSDLESVSEGEQIISDGNPTLIMFYSDY